MEDTRWLWIDEQQSGPFPLAEISRMAHHDEIDSHTLFWSPSREKWIPLAGLMIDVEPGRIQKMRDSGVRRVEILGSGTGQDCRACRALASHTYSIHAVPELPPAGCTCIPWCRSVLIAVD